MMGLWGYFLVGRSDGPLADHEALREIRDWLTPWQQRADGWQVWTHPSEPALGDMASLAGELRAPCLFGYVMDSACAVVEAAAPHSGSWYACLGRAPMAAHLVQDDMVLEDLFLPPEDAAARAVQWAAETGRGVLEGPLLELLRIERPEASAEDLFFAFLDRLGLEGLPD